MLIYGFVVASMAFFGYSHMSLQSGTWDIFLHQINQGSGMAFVFVPLTVVTMDPVPKAETGYATSLYSVMRNIGSSIGVSFVTTWVARRSQFHQSILAAHVTRYDLRSQQFLGLARGLFFHQGFDWSTAGRRSLGVLYGMLRQQAALISFIEVFRIMGFFFLATVPLVLLMRKARRPRSAPAAD
jgi:DHA2 family multidrug resistance protein